MPPADGFLFLAKIVRALLIHIKDDTFHVYHDQPGKLLQTLFNNIVHIDFVPLLFPFQLSMGNSMQPPP